MITNWFLSLNLSTAIGLVFFGSILIGCLFVSATDAAVNAVVQHRIAAVDEFAYADDAWAEISKPIVHGISIQRLSDAIVKSDDEFRQIDLKSFTCTTCIAQNYCAYAFDLYNTDGDCLADK